MSRLKARARSRGTIEVRVAQVDVEAEVARVGEGAVNESVAIGKRAELVGQSHGLCSPDLLGPAITRDPRPARTATAP